MYSRAVSGAFAGPSGREAPVGLQRHPGCRSSNVVQNGSLRAAPTCSGRSLRTSATSLFLYEAVPTKEKPAARSVAVAPRPSKASTCAPEAQAVSVDTAPAQRSAESAPAQEAELQHELRSSARANVSSNGAQVAVSEVVAKPVDAASPTDLKDFFSTLSAELDDAPTTTARPRGAPRPRAPSGPRVQLPQRPLPRSNLPKRLYHAAPKTGASPKPFSRPRHVRRRPVRLPAVATDGPATGRDSWLLTQDAPGAVAATLRTTEAGTWDAPRLVPLLHRLHRLGHWSTIVVLVCHVCETQPTLAAEILRQARRHGLKRQLLAWAKRSQSAGAVVAMVTCTLQREGVPQGLLSLGLKAAASAGDASAAEVIMDRLKASGRQPSAAAFGNMIIAYGKAGRVHRAKSVLLAMRKAGVRPNIITYTTLIKACTSAGACDEAIAIFHAMDVDRVRADLQAYNSLMAAFSKQGKWQEAWSVLGSMRRADISPDIVSYNTLLKACQRCGEWRRVVELYSRMEREFERSALRPNLVTFNTVIDAAASVGEAELAQGFFDAMIERGIQPDQVTISSLVHAYDRAGEHEQAVAAFKQLCKRGVRPNAVGYNCAISAMAGASDTAGALLLVREMRGNGYEPDRATYKPLFAALGRSGRIDEAFQLMDDMRAAGQRPEPDLYTSLIVACEQCNDWRRAVQVFYAMQREGVEMNTIALAARRILYYWPDVLPSMPPTVIAAARAAVNTGRKARSSVDKLLRDIPRTL